MPLNNLLYRHQVALMRATVSASPGGRQAHEATAAALADQVEKLGEAAGASTAPLARSQQESVR